MKVLFITNTYLDSNGGGTFASRAFINIFSQIYDECVLLFPFRGKDVSESISDSVKLVGVSKRKNIFSYLLDFYLGKIHRFHDEAVVLLDNYNPDLVVFDNSRCSYGIIKKAKEKGIKAITIHHNFEVEYYHANPPLFIWRSIFLYHIRKAEKDSIFYSDLNFTLTLDDLVNLNINYCQGSSDKFVCIGVFESKNILPLNIVKRFDENLTFIITGSLDSIQTEVSLLHFFDIYLPIIIKLYPTAKLLIAGKEPSKKFQKRCVGLKNVELVINPENIYNTVVRGNVYISPIFLGGGLKLRIMDALKCGLPVLAHSISARGYEKFVSKEYILTYNDIQSFETSLQRIVEIQSEEVSMSLYIREMYHSIFDFSSGVKLLKDELEKSYIL
jgi:glycosyltransferase involved in cell wall biosynthesis